MNGIKQRISDWQPRKLLCFSAAFSMVAALVTVFISYHIDTWFLITAVIVAICTILIILLFQDKLVSFTIGLLVGLIWCGGFVHFYYSSVQDLSGYGGDLALQVIEYPDTDQVKTLDVRILSVAGMDTNAKARVYLDAPIDDIAPGDMLHCIGIIEDGDLRLSRNRLQKGIYLTVELSKDSEISVERDSALDIFCRAARLGKGIQRRIQTLIPGDPGNLLAAMIGGNSSICSPALQNSLINTGLAHIAAVSGLHISVLVGFFVTILGKRKGYLVVFPVIICYALIAGASPSAMRAICMQIILMISVFFYQEYDPMSALFAALLFLVAQNPFAVLSTSLLLSFAATFGILLMNGTLMEIFHHYRPKKRWLSNFYYGLSGSIAVSLSAMVFTLPITLLIFGRASMLSLLSNLLTIWAVEISITGGMILLLLSLISMPLAIPFAWILRFPLLYLVWIAKKLGSFTEFVGQSGSLILELGTFAALVCMVLVRVTKTSRGLGVWTVCLLLIGTFTMSSLELVLYNEVQIYGNYGAPLMLIRDGNRSIAVGIGRDGARNVSQIEDTLSDWSKSQLSAVICLSDHVKSTGSLETVTERFSPENIFLPEGSSAYQLNTPNVWWFSQAGIVSVPDTTGIIELIPITKETWALRWLCHDFSIVALYGGQPLELSVGLENYSGDISADILLTDATILNSTYAAEYICGRVSPSMVLVADSGFETLPRNILGVPVESLYENGMITITTKR